MASKHLWATKLTDNSSTAKEQLGIKRVEWDSSDACFKAYRYVVTASDTTVANGTALGYSDTLGQTVSLDCDDYSENQAAGVGIGVITAGYYGWIQTGGYHSAVKTDAGDDIADGDYVILHATTDGVCDRTAAATAAVSRPLGFAVADDINASDTVATFLTLDDN